MKTHHTDNLFFGLLTGVMSLTMMLVACVAIAQSALQPHPANLARQSSTIERVSAAAELPAGAPVRL